MDRKKARERETETETERLCAAPISALQKSVTCSRTRRRAGHLSPAHNQVSG